MVMLCIRIPTLVNTDCKIYFFRRTGYRLRGRSAWSRWWYLRHRWQPPGTSAARRCSTYWRRWWRPAYGRELVITLSSNEFNSFWIFIDFWNCFVRVSNHYLLSWYQWINKYNILVMTEFELRRFKLVYIYQNDIYIMTETAKNHRNKKKPNITRIFVRFFFLDVVSEYISWYYGSALGNSCCLGDNKLVIVHMVSK